MATKKGVWNLQQVRDKQLQSLWGYSSSVNAFFTWGRNQYGELGQNSPAYAARSSPTQVPGSWSKIATDSSSYNMGGIKNDGTLWGWGRNNYGQLGQNEPGNSHYSSPVQIPGTWSEAKIGNALSCAVNTSGELFTMGFNNDGALGINVYQGSRSSPCQVPGTNWKQCTVNTYSMAATRTDGTLWAWGAAGNGQLGQNSRTYYSSPVQIPGTTWSIVDGSSTQGFMAVKTDGTLWVWGRNTTGMLGQNEDSAQKYSSPVQIPGSWGTSKDYISYGSAAAGAITANGELYMWGSGGPGQLAQNNNTSYSSPRQVPGTTWCAIMVGNDTAFARKTDGTLWTWGENEEGKLGINLPEANPNAMRSSPVQVPGTDWSSAATTMKMGAALKLL